MFTSDGFWLVDLVSANIMSRRLMHSWIAVEYTLSSSMRRSHPARISPYLLIDVPRGSESRSQMRHPSVAVRRGRRLRRGHILGKSVAHALGMSAWREAAL